MVTNGGMEKMKRVTNGRVAGEKMWLRGIEESVDGRSDEKGGIMRKGVS